MSTKIENIVRPGYALAFILIIISYALFFYSLKLSNDARHEIDRTHASIKTLEEVSAAFRDIEVGMRGYLLVGDPKFLTPYNNGIKGVDSGLVILDRVVDRGNPEIMGLYNEIRELCDRKERQAEMIISHFQTNNKLLTDSIRSLMWDEKKVMDEQRENMRLMRAAQEEALTHFGNSQRSTNKSTRTIAIISLIIVLLIGTYSLITFNKENLAKRKSEEVKRIYAVELEKRIEQLAATNLELDRHRRIEKFVATGRMASTMAHEIKNPLNNISLALEQLGEVIGKQQDSAMLLEIIKRNTTRINVLVTDLLNSTRYLQLKFVTVSINDIIDQALEIAKDRLQLQHVDIVKNYDSDICKVNVDPDKIGIAFLNIIINAVEAMEGRPGKIEILTEAKENSCYITIKDNGNGMPPEVLSKLFEPFHSTKSKGTGLGLTNSQNIILNHGGLINVESEYKKGSAFIIQLPFNQPE